MAWDYIQKVFDRTTRAVTTLADGEAVVKDALGLAKLTIETGAGCTATWSRVDTYNASAHTAQTATQGASGRTVIDIDWPFFRVSAAGGSCRVAMV